MVIALATSMQAQSGEVGFPSEIKSAVTDVRVEAAKEKKSKERQSKTDEQSETESTKLDQRIMSGDLQAAIIKVNRTKKNKERVADLSNRSAIEAILDKGVADGVPEAIRLKGVTEADRENYGAAVGHLREASRRGSAEADYELAALKARQPSLGGVGESAISLLHKAAAKGDAQAAMELGLALHRGAWLVGRRHAVMMEQSDSKALAWMERAELLGSDEAAFWLGLHYMRQTQSLVDVSRVKGIELLLMVRRASPELQEPSSGKTFVQLEGEGAFEEGILAEIKRRETKEKTTLAERRAERAEKSAAKAAEANNQEVKAISVKEIDNATIEIAGSAERGRPVYNLIGLSPYREVAGEGAVVSIGAEKINVDDLPAVADVAGWRLELLEEGKPAHSFVVTSLDGAGNSVGAAVDNTVKLSDKTRWRLVRYHTFLSTFGADNRAGLKPGLSPDAADEVIVFEGGMARRRQFYFRADTLEWMERNGDRLVTDIEITPGSALLIKRTEPGTLSLAVRGVLPETVFDFEPVSGISLVSIRRSQLEKSVPDGSTAETVSPLPAAELKVLSKKGKNGKWTYGRRSPSDDWWSAAGLTALDLVNMPGTSAVVGIKE